MPNRLVRQLARPSGLVGREVVFEMAAANNAMIRAAIGLLEVQPGDNVLEVGFGNPRSLARLAELADPGRVVGVDHSTLAIRRAQRRLKPHAAAGRVLLREASASRLPIDDRSIDRLLAINTITYWPDLDAGFAELRRVAADGARLVIGVRAPEVLERRGINGDGVHHLELNDITDLATRHGWATDDAIRDADRAGAYILARLRTGSEVSA